MPKPRDDAAALAGRRAWYRQRIAELQAQCVRPAERGALQ